MGQTYSVYLKVRFKDEEGAKKALHDKISKGHDEHVEYDVEGLVKKHHFDMDDIRDILSVFFSGWGSRLRDTTQEGVITSDFDACYGWESIMIEAFDLLAPFAEEGSWMKIYPDYDYDHMVVKDGKAVMLH